MLHLDKEQMCSVKFQPSNSSY